MAISDVTMKILDVFFHGIGYEQENQFGVRQPASKSLPQHFLALWLCQATHAGYVLASSFSQVHIVKGCLGGSVS